MKKSFFFSLFFLCGLYFSSGSICAQEPESEEVKNVIINQLQNPEDQSYVYTPDSSQREELKEQGYDYQGTSWVSPEISDFPVYKLENANGDIYYTMKEEETSSYVEQGWINQGIAWYSSDNEEIPVFCVYNQNTGSYYYTTNFDEYFAMKEDGWTRLGIAWYGWSQENKERFEEYKKANQNTIEDGSYTIQSKDTEKYVDTNGSLSSNNTLWRFENLENGYVKIRNTSSNKVLTVSDTSKYEGVKVQEALFENQNSQMWIVEDTGNGYIITSSLMEKYVLSSFNNILGVYSKDSIDSYLWDLERILSEREKIDIFAKNNQTVKDGVYRITISADVTYGLSGEPSNIANNANVRINKLDGSSRQIWTIKNEKDGYYSLINQASQKALSVSDVVNKSNLYQYDYSGEYGQKWIIVQNNDNSYTIYSALDIGFVVDLNSLSVKDSDNGIIFNYDQSIYQYWTLTLDPSTRENIDTYAKDNQTLKDGVYAIVVKTDTRYGISGEENSTNVSNALLNGTRIQNWIIENVNNGYYSIINVSTSKALTVDEAVDKSNVYLQDYKDGYDQKWIFRLNNDGSYTICSALNFDYVLDLNSISIKAGDNGIVFHYDTSAYQYYTMTFIRDIVVDHIEYSYDEAYVDDVSNTSGVFNAVIRNLSTNGDLLKISFVVESESKTMEVDSIFDSIGNYYAEISSKLFNFDIGEYIVTAKLLFAGSQSVFFDMGTCLVLDALQGLQESIQSLIASKTTKGKVQVYFQMVDSERGMAINATGSQQSASVIKLFVMGTVYDNYESICAYKSKDTIDSNLKKMITVSDNTAWKNLVAWLGNGSYSEGCKVVTSWAQAHGYMDTYTEGVAYHNYTCAKDSAQIVMDMYNGRFTHSEDMLNLMLQQQRRSKIPAGIPSGVVVGNKTGELADNVARVENDTGIVYSAAGTYVLSVMTYGFDNSVEKSLVVAISRMIYNFFN